MKIIPITITHALLALLLLFLTCSMEDRVFNESDVQIFESSVNGSIIDKRGKTLCGVTVTAFPCGITTVSNPAGQFTLSGLPAGNHALYLKLIDYLDTVVADSVSLTMLESKALPAPVKMTYRYAILCGVVKDQSNVGQPDAGIQVEEQNVAGLSNINGNFILKKVEPGNIKLFAVVKDIGYGTKEMLVMPDTILENIELIVNEKGSSVTGTVTNDKGSPINGAKVIVFDQILDTSTNASGYFLLNGIPNLTKIPTIITNGMDTIIVGNIIADTLSIPDLGTIVLQSIVVTESIKIHPGIFLATTAEGSVMLIAYTNLTDSTIKIAEYEWDWDNDGSWDTLTPTCRVKYQVPTTAGTYTVKVRCADTNSYYSNTADLTVRVSQGNRPARFTSTPGEMCSTATVGTPYSDTVHAVDDDGDSLMFSLGVSDSNIILTDNIITWTPQPVDVGKKSVSVAVTDGKGEFDSLPWTITVNTVTDSSPVITKDPEFPLNVFERESVTLSVSATCLLQLSYQWQENESDIPGSVAKDSSYTFIADMSQNDKRYRCVVSNNAGGVKNSKSVTALVNDGAPVLITPPDNDSVETNQVVLQWHPGYFQLYKVLLDNTNPPNTVYTTSFSDTVLTTNPLVDGIYYWQVIGAESFDTTGETDSSAIWKFILQNDTIVNLELYKAVTGQINQVGQIVTYTFGCTKISNNPLTIRFKPDNTFDSRIQVLDPDLDTLIVSDETGGYMNCIDTLRQPKIGTYSIKISSIPGNQTCSYTLGLYPMVAAIDSATVLQLNNPANNTIDPNVDLDSYKYNWQGYDTLSIQFSPNGNTFKSTIRIVDPRGDIFTENYAIDGNENVIDPLNFTEKGIYLFEVYATDGNDTCTYDITLQITKEKQYLKDTHAGD